MVQDPAAGTGGFLIAADRLIKTRTDDLFVLPTAQQDFQKYQAFYGLELVRDTHRLLLMNLMLHGIEGSVELGDTLSSNGQGLPKADLILTNPPFGTKIGGGRPTRDDFTYPTSNKQLAFLQHIYRCLKPGGRAAVVLSDNVLFEDDQGRSIRADLMDKCNLHTIGFTQLAVEMIALAMDEAAPEQIYGAVTMGNFWSFGVLNKETKYSSAKINRQLLALTTPPPQSPLAKGGSSGPPPMPFGQANAKSKGELEGVSQLLGDFCEAALSKLLRIFEVIRCRMMWRCW